MLSSGSGDQLCSSPAVLLWCWVFAVLVYWGLISLLHSLSLGQGQWSVSLVLSEYCDGLLIVFQFCSVIWLWMLLTDSGDELCGPLPALFQEAPYHRPAVGPSAFLAFIYWKFMWRSAPYSSPPLLVNFQCFCPLCCVLVFSSFLIQYFFYEGEGSVCPGGYAGLS
jgi:hypothetical protein